MAKDSKIYDLPYFVSKSSKLVAGLIAGASGVVAHLAGTPYIFSGIDNSPSLLDHIKGGGVDALVTLTVFVGTRIALGYKSKRDYENRLERRFPRDSDVSV